jgi:hypothetical protein
MTQRGTYRVCVDVHRRKTYIMTRNGRTALGIHDANQVDRYKSWHLLWEAATEEPMMHTRLNHLIRIEYGIRAKNHEIGACLLLAILVTIDISACNTSRDVDGSVGNFRVAAAWDKIA